MEGLDTCDRGSSHLLYCKTVHKTNTYTFKSQSPILTSKLPFRATSFSSSAYLRTSVSSVQPLRHVGFFVAPWSAARQASLSFTISPSLPKLMSIVSVMPSNHLVLCHPFSCLLSFPASGSFPVSRLFASVGQSTGVSASGSVLPMNLQG